MTSRYTTYTPVTNEQIRALRIEAGQAGDSKMVDVCDRALNGDEYARRSCTDAINEALAMDDSNGR